MRVLLIGGTGLISVGIVKHLLALRADVTLFNRGQRSKPLAGTTAIVGDRDDFAAFEARFASERFDVVIDMVAYTPEQAASAIRAFAGRCEQFIFCSTVCTYGTRMPANVIIDESFPPSPTTGYGRNKLACERLLLDAHARGDFQTTILRPSHTYGPGGGMIDQLEYDGPAWSRVARGEPVLIADGGLVLWNSTHRDDCGKAFALACLNPVAYGRAYHATTERVFTWRDFYREVGQAIGRPTRIVSVSSDWILSKNAKRFAPLAEIFRFHGAFTSVAAQRDLGFSAPIRFVDGVRETFADPRGKQQLERGHDAEYDALVAEAIAAGGVVVDA